MQEDNHLVKMIDYENAADCFNGMHIDGGVCYFMWDNTYNGKIDYTHIKEDGTTCKRDSLSSPFSSFVIRDARILSILEKTSSEERFSSIVSRTKPFGIRKDLFNKPERYPNSGLSETLFEGALKCYGVKGIKGGAKRKIGFITPQTATDRYNAISKYKIFFTTTYSTNAVEAPAAILAEKDEICTETFLLIGPFDNQSQRDNCANYMKSTLFRFLLYFAHGTMQVNKEVFNLIPLVDFSKQWTDKELYKKYSITEDEQKFIETIIKP